MVFDGHSDIFSDVRYRREAGERNVLKHRHLERLKKGGIDSSCFVIWAETMKELDPAAEMDAIIRAMQAEMAETEEFVLVHNTKELEAAKRDEKFAILLGLEGLAGIGEDIDKIYELYGIGCRHAMLTWNEENALATGVKGSPDRGLTILGKRAAKRIQDQKMILDVSHLNERSFWDVVDLTAAPLLASHSNAKALASAARNLTDAQLRALRDTDGLIGLNAYHHFVSDVTAEQDVDHLVHHAAYIADKIGAEHLALGLDFLEYLEDEPDPASQLRGMEDCSKVPVLLEKMKKAGFSEKEMEMICHQNWAELIRKIMG